MLRSVFVIMFLGVINFVQSSNLSILKHNKKLYCMMTNDTTNTAIAWDSKYTGASFRYITITKLPNWEFSTEFARVPILDYRWELFPMETKCHYKLPFGDFIMSVSIQGTSNVYLCETDDKENCYNILLSENGPSRSNNVARLLCNDFNSTPKNSEWLHFTLSRKNHRLHVKQHGKNNIIELKDLYAPKYLAINGKWKIHTSNLHTPKWSNGPSRTVLQPDIKPNKIICFGLLVYVPKYSLMKLSLYNKNKLVSEQTNTKLEGLEEVKLCGNISTTELTLKIDIADTYFLTSQLYIAEVVRISKLPDIRIATLKQEEENENYCCYDIKSSKKLCTQDLATYNPPGILDCNFTSVGANCIPCTRIFSEAYCTNVSICDYTSTYSVYCSCPSGYRYAGCTEKCPYKYYGFDCKKYCNHCQGSCDHVTGMCNSCNGGSNNCLTERAAFRTTTINETSVSISWGLSDVEVHSVQYKIIYWHTNYPACSTNELVQHSDKMEITVDKNSALLTDLLPYSNYTVVISSLNDSEKPQQVNISTPAAAMLSENDIPRIYTVQNASQLELRLEINGCSKVTGSTSYIIRILCNSAWCQEKDNVFENITDRWNIAKNVPVLGHTNYTIKVRVHRNVSFKDIEVSILTSPTAPTAVRDLTAYNVTSTSIGIRWLKPYPPTGVLAEYAVWWTPAYIWRNFSSEAHYCKIWREYICAQFDTLTPNRNYVFQIRAKNKNCVEDGPYEEISEITISKAPSVPENITYFWKDINNTLVLKWKHPNNPNGFIKEFYAYKSIQYIKTFLVTEERLEYRYELKYNELNTTSSSNLEIGIFANNGVESSDGTRSTIPTPPKTPMFLNNASAFNITSTSTRVQIPKVLYLDGESSFLFVIVIDKEAHSEKHLNVNDKEIIGRAVGIDEEVKFRIAVNHSLNLSSYGMEEFDFGNELLQNLHAGTTYEIYLLVKNEYKNISRYAVLKLTVTTLSSYYYMPFLLILIIPVECIIVFIFYKRNKNKMKNLNNASLRTIPSEHVYEEVTQREDEALGPAYSTRAVDASGSVELSQFAKQYPRGAPEVQYDDRGDRNSLQSEHVYTEVLPESATTKQNCDKPQHHLKSSSRHDIYPTDERVLSEGNEQGIASLKTNTIRSNSTPGSVWLSEFERYVKHCLESEELEKQYKQVVPEVQYNYAGDGNSLQLLNIKASYVDGYGTTKSYIATVVPQSNNTDYFWKMVWQEHVNYIIMVTDATQCNQDEIKQFCPDVNTTRYYGDIAVSSLEVTSVTYHKSTLLELTFEGIVRQVQHLNFTAWPCSVLPYYPQALALFLKQIRRIPYGKQPIVIQSSKGFGRIATFIMCDICRRCAAATGKVDVYSCLRKLREQRINIDNVDQYKFVHLVLLHCLVESANEIRCTKEMIQKIKDIILSPSILPKQMRNVQDSSWEDEAISTMWVKTKSITEGKNTEIVEDGYTKIILKSPTPCEKLSPCIDTVQVERFYTSSEFIVTQYPMQSTLTEFWRLIDKCEIDLILCLNEFRFEDKTYCKFYPSLNESLCPVYYLKVDCTEVEKAPHYNIYTVHITNSEKDKKKRIIKILHINQWEYSMLHPKSPEGLFMVYEEMNRCAGKANSIHITCVDGTRASGLYTSLCYLIEKMKMEQICDVCLAVRTVRRNQPRLVRDLEQFSFLYQCALFYIKKFEM